jgi:hypothetical protein
MIPDQLDYGVVFFDLIPSKRKKTVPQFRQGAVGIAPECSGDILYEQTDLGVDKSFTLKFPYQQFRCRLH